MKEIKTDKYQEYHAIAAALDWRVTAYFKLNDAGEEV